MADVNVDPANPVIGIRSFGAHPSLVSTMTAAAVDGFHQAGEVSVAKHFPGHGDTDVDSHTGPVVANDRETASGVRHEDRYLPLRSKRVYVAGPAAAGLTAALRPVLAATGGRLVASPAEADVIVAATRDAVRDAAQQRLVRGLVASGRPVLVLATGLPYDLGLFPGIRAAVASYSDSSVSLGAAAAVLAGRLPPAGLLPVAIPAAAGGRAFGYGTGLSY